MIILKIILIVFTVLQIEFEFVIMIVSVRLVIAQSSKNLYYKV